MEVRLLRIVIRIYNCECHIKNGILCLYVYVNIPKMKEKAPLRKESANSGSQELKYYTIGHEPFAQSISVIIEFNFLYGL